MNTTYPQLTSRQCPECGNTLLLVSKTVESLEGEYLPVTTSTYRCSNEECQEGLDKKTAERKKKYLLQEAAKQNRINNRKAQYKVKNSV